MRQRDKPALIATTAHATGAGEPANRDRRSPFSAARMPLLIGTAIAALGIWGLIGSEPYWRTVGHSPRSFDALLWALTLLTGPASMIARIVADNVMNNADGVFVIQFLLWIALAAAEWCLLIRVAGKRPQRRHVLAVLAWSVPYIAWGMHVWRVRWPMVHHGEMVDAGVLNLPFYIFGVALVPVIWLLLAKWRESAGQRARRFALSAQARQWMSLKPMIGMHSPTSRADDEGR